MNEAIKLPKEVLDRVARVHDYHRATGHRPESVWALKPQTDLSGLPRCHRTFPNLPKVVLPTTLLDLPIAALSLIRDGLAALPDSQVQPPQDLKTIATWLHMAYGITAEREASNHKYRLRACPSASALFPCEIYVAAFAIQGLEPGLYSFNPRDFSLAKLREGDQTLAQIKRGRPDLAFLKSVPAALLVSTIFWRSAWKYQARGYRVAVQDAGHLVANLVLAANGLGIQTQTRLKVNDNTMRELIGIAPDADFGTFEAVQAMIVWADEAVRPMAMASSAPAGTLSPIERRPLSPGVVPHGSIVAVHYDCVAPGIPLRDIHPPLTELSPMPAKRPMQSLAPGGELPLGPSLRKVLLGRRSSRDFLGHGIARDVFIAINQAAFRSGTFLPLHPNGPHAGLIRPFWVIHDVSGLNCGIWYYHPPTDQWTLLRPGDYRALSQHVCLDQARCGNAAALCLMTANLQVIMEGAGPDAYRLAQLEAGIVGQRLALAACASGIGACGIGSFYDEEARLFLGLLHTGWEVLYAIALGIPARQIGPRPHPGLGIG